MFWKRWKKSEQNGQEEDFFRNYVEDRRRYLRVEPAPEEPVFFVIGEIRCPVQNVGPGGMAFQASGCLREGDQIAGRLLLPDREQPISLTGRVVLKERNGTTHLEIIELEKTGYRDIDAFVLSRQKEGNQKA